jgi:beta-D-galactosyl-(1->4)-L-rhamnose phosphorylase
MSGFSTNPVSSKMLQNLLLYAATGNISCDGLTDNPWTECAVFPEADKLVFINNSMEPQDTSCVWKDRAYCSELEPYAMKAMDI